MVNVDIDPSSLPKPLGIKQPWECYAHGNVPAADMHPEGNAAESNVVGRCAGPNCRELATVKLTSFGGRKMATAPEHPRAIKGTREWQRPEPATMVDDGSVAYCLWHSFPGRQNVDRKVFEAQEAAKQDAIRAAEANRPKTLHDLHGATDITITSNASHSLTLAGFNGRITVESTPTEVLAFLLNSR